MTLNDTIAAPPSHATISGYRDCNGNPVGTPPGEYSPQNDEGGAVGNVSLYKATAASINTAFAKLEQQVTICKVTQMADSLGVHQAGYRGTTTKLLQVPSMTLGANLIAPMTMAAAYASFAADGKFCQPVGITSITSASGKKYSAPNPNCVQAIDKGVAEGVTSALQKVILAGGTAPGIGLPGRESAGKTGTTNENKQAWFVGYTPQLSTAVYVGHPTIPNRSLNGQDVGNGHRLPGAAFGGQTAGPIWHTMMSKMVDLLNLSPQNFTRPPFSVIGSAPQPTPTNTPTGGPTQPGPSNTPTGSPTTKGGGGKKCPPHKPVC
jgi:membrane peptidoglycan carboxypeptidase